MRTSHKQPLSAALARPAFLFLAALGLVLGLLGLSSISWQQRIGLKQLTREAAPSGRAESSVAKPPALNEVKAETKSPPLPNGLTAADWAGIHQAYEQRRHAVVPVASNDSPRWQARNPGQQLQAKFDGRGFAVEPEGANWQWGLELRSYGFAGSERAVSGQAQAKAQQTRVSYAWDETLEEWFVNDQRGLEHGFTLRERPAGAGGRLELRLAVRGGLKPQVQSGGRGVSFINQQGQAAVNYAGLKVWDADGRELAAGFEASESELRLSVDEAGARYPLTIDPLIQQAYLKASNTGNSDQFGHAIAISGDTVVVGANLEDSNATGINPGAAAEANNSASGAGAAYVFVRSGGVWSQQAYLKPASVGTTQADDQFGTSVAISGDTIVVGAFNEDSSSTGINSTPNESAANAGAAYVFVRSSGVWSQQAYLKPASVGTTQANDRFGGSVSISGETIAVGAVGEDSNTTGTISTPNESGANSGATYIFVRSGTMWSQQAYIKASTNGPNDQFGFAVGVSGDTLVVGAPDEDSNATGVNPTTGVGTGQNNNSSSSAGAAYTFLRTGTVWAQQAYLKASNTDASGVFGSVGFDGFGAAVAVSGDTVVIGALREASNATGINPGPAAEANNSAFGAGAAYVFVRNAGVWSQQAYLKASNAEAGDNFAISVSISGDTIVVGAYGEASNATGVNPPTGVDTGQNNNDEFAAGAAYVFMRSGTTWTQEAYLKASNAGFDDYFGISVSVSGDTIAVGARFDDSNATGVNGDQSDTGLSSGAAFIFSTAVAPTIAKAFDPPTIQAGGTSTITFTLTNSNGSALTNANFTDTLTNMSVSSATIGGTCSGVTNSPALAVGATGTNALNLTVPTLNPGSCTITVQVTSNTPGTHPNQTSGVTSTQTPTAGAASGAVSLTVLGAPSINKAFSPATIQSGGTSTITFTLTNSNGSALTNANFTDTLTNMSVSSATIGSTCSGVTNSPALAVGATGTNALNLTVPTLNPGSCTITVQVTSNTPGTHPNQTSGVTSTQTPTAGAASNIVSLTVEAPPTTRISASDPAVCNGPGSVVSITAQITNNGSTPQMTTLSSVLPSQLTAVPGTCNATSNGAPLGTFNACGGASVNWSGTLPGNQTVTITYQAQLADNVQPGATICYNSTITFGVAAPIQLPVCVTVNCPTVGPGAPPPAAAAVSDQKPGSVLFYNLYTSNPANLSQQNSRINITNTDPARSVAVHLFFVDGASCTPADVFICLTPNQTMSFLASDIDPGTTGYIVAVAVDAVTGCPINFNFLIGDAFVKLASGHQANLAAESFAALTGTPPVCAPGSLTATLNFDGVSYNQVPRVLAVDNFPSVADGNNTLVILNRVGGNLLSGTSSIGSLFGVLFDEAEQPLSFTLNSNACQFRFPLTNASLRTVQRLETVIGSGRTGWLRLWGVNDIGLLGSVINFNATAGVNNFNQGHNLHKLTFTSASLTIPIIPSACQ